MENENLKKELASLIQKEEERFRLLQAQEAKLLEQIPHSGNFQAAMDRERLISEMEAIERALSRHRTQLGHIR